MGVVGAEILEQQVAVARDHREQVVEIVGDAAGEPTHGLHFLRLKELLLEPLDAGPVLDQAEDAGDAAVGLVQRRGDQVHGHRCAVFLLADHFDVRYRVAPHHPPPRLLELRCFAVHGG